MKIYSRERNSSGIVNRRVKSEVLVSLSRILPTLGRSMYLALLSLTSLYLYGFIYLTKSSFLSFIFTSSAMVQTRKVNKDMCWVNNLILENHLTVLSLTLYTDINAIVITLGLALFISLVNCFLILTNEGNSSRSNYYCWFIAA